MSYSIHITATAEQALINALNHIEKEDLPQSAGLLLYSIQSFIK